MNVKKTIDIHSTLLFIPSFREGDRVVDIFDDFITCVPEVIPERWAFGEPINKEVDVPAMRQELIRTGSRDFLWRRRKFPQGWGVLYTRTYPKRGPQHAHHYLTLAAKSDSDVAKYVKYLQQAGRKFGVEYACCDTLSPMYKQRAAMNNLSPYGGNMTVYTHTLMRWLPDIVWGQIFGPAYVRLFGIEKLLSAPAYKVERLASNMVYLQLSESMFDEYENYEEVDVVRQKVKEHLDSNIFFNRSLPPDHTYNTPHFEFPE